MPHCALCRKCQKRASGSAVAQEQERVLRGLRHRKETRRARVTSSERRRPDRGEHFKTATTTKKMFCGVFHCVGSESTREVGNAGQGGETSSST